MILFMKGEKGMPLHHYIEQYFQQHPNARIKGILAESPPIEKRPKVSTIEDREIAVGTHSIPIRIYTPTDEENQHAPLFIFFHGSRFVNEEIDTQDVPCRMITSLSGYKVIAVDYRLSPENLLASAFEDCYFVTKWIIKNAHEIGGKSEEVSLGGSSIGGNIAISIALKSIKTGDFTLSKQLLFYPIIDLDTKVKGSDYTSRALFNAKYGVDITNDQANLLQVQQATPPYVSHLNIETNLLAKMPQTLIFTAEYDPLCDEGELYAQKLKKAGADIKLVRFDGNIHGFMQYFPGSPDYMRGYEITAEFLVENDD